MVVMSLLHVCPHPALPGLPAPQSKKNKTVTYHNNTVHAKACNQNQKSEKKRYNLSVVCKSVTAVIYLGVKRGKDQAVHIIQFWLRTQSQRRTVGLLRGALSPA